MSSGSVTLKCSGLQLSPNNLEVPPGGLSEASNVIVRRDDVIESRRGFNLYGDPFGNSQDRADQLLFYKTRLLRHFNDILQFDTGSEDTNGTEIFNQFAGSYNEAQPGLRIKSVESNGNFYFTTADGIKKISASNPNQLSTAPGYITQAGGIQAIDQTATLDVIPTLTNGAMVQDSVVEYSVVWGTKDINNNLILGTPSQVSVVYNSLLTLMLYDLMNLLQTLNRYTPTLSIDYVNTFKLPLTARPEDLQTTLKNLTVQLDIDFPSASGSFVLIPPPNETLTLIANDTGNGSAPLIISNATISTSVCTVSFSSGSATSEFTVGDQITLTGFTTTTGNINGSELITAVTPTYIQFLTSASGSVSFIGATISTNVAVPVAALSTDQALVSIQTYIDEIINTLVGQSVFFDTVTTTIAANVKLVIDIPNNVTTNYFFQIYRSPNTPATGVEILGDLVPSSELQLIYEAFPTLAEIAAGSVTAVDSSPDTLLGAFLYTNQNSGQGILQANTPPPFALDVTRFKNVVFYANTRLLQQLSLSLLGVQLMINDFNNGSISTITIANESSSSTYQFTPGIQEIQKVTCNTSLNSSGPGSYFLLNSANNEGNETDYYVWYQRGTSTDPLISGRTGIQVSVPASPTTTQVALKTSDAIAIELFDFTTSASTSVCTIICNNVGYTTAASNGTTSFTFNVTQTGTGERASTKEILLSTDTSPGIAIQETSQSLIRVINRNHNSFLYGYYISGIASTPGQMLLQGKILDPNPFYIVGNSVNVGLEFNPNIAPNIFGTIAPGNPAIITVTSASSGLINQDQILISNLPGNTSPSIAGIYQITLIDPTHFSIPVSVSSVSNASVSFILLSDAALSDDSLFPNRLYYSKLQQPEAVPLVNFFEVGDRDKAILRIVTLRESLFIFKQDGLFFITGQNAPFTLDIFDLSCLLLAPDSIGVTNNLIFGWTQQGISVVSEAGVSNPPISRPIDTVILPTATFPNFVTSTWGVGYPSDNSYYVFTNKLPTDTEATICYRYGNLTNSWTTFDMTATCGIVPLLSDFLYIGNGDVNFLSKERKNFDRTDYADREIGVTITPNMLVGTNITLSTVNGIAVGDVLYQQQLVTVYEFNGLLEKLDADPGLAVVPITSISTGFNPTIITSGSNNLVNGEFVQLSNTDSVPSIDGVYQITFISPTHFKITVSESISVAGTTGTARFLYAANLTAKAGDDLKTDMLNLANKLDSDPNTVYKNYFTDIAPQQGIITSITATSPTIVRSSSATGLKTGRVILIAGSNSNPSIDGTRSVTVTSSSTFTLPISIITVGNSGNFETIEDNINDMDTCFSILINDLNLDSGLVFKNYINLDQPAAQETIITNVNKSTHTITVNNKVDYVVGDAIIFKSIPCAFTYTPITLGDPLNTKQMYEATLMFANKAFTSGTLSFSSDLQPVVTPIPFLGDGNGIFGNGNFGYGYFGGGSNGAPFRTLIPAVNQRCRYLIAQFDHNIAREQWAVFGLTVVGNINLSSRGYR